MYSFITIFLLPHRRMDAMVNAAIKDRKLHTLAGWEQQHRECIMGSMPLIEVGRRRHRHHTMPHHTNGWLQSLRMHPRTLIAG